MTWFEVVFLWVGALGFSILGLGIGVSLHSSRGR